MRRIVLSVSVLCILAAAGVAEAKIRMATVGEKVAASDVIVVGKVTSVIAIKGAPEVQKIEIAVTDVLKGEAGKTIALKMTSGMHNTVPAVDSSHVFFLKPAADKEDGFVQAMGNSPNSISDSGEADKVKETVAAETAASKPAK